MWGLDEPACAEDAVVPMLLLTGHFVLDVIGTATMLYKFKEMVRELKLSSRVTFIDALPYNQMTEYTRQCFLGLIFEKIDFTDEHLFALPNKFFDYLHAGVPVLSSKAVEIELIIEKYQVGDFINSLDPLDIAKKIMEIAKDMEVYNSWKRNTAKASEELNWENEEKILINFMDHLS